MKNAAAIAAQLVDVRNVGLHKCIKLTLHVPAEQAAEVMAAFGWPTAAEPVPVALARLNKPASESEPPVRARSNVAPEKRLARDAALMCKEAGFQQWLRREYRGTWRLTDYKMPDEERAAATVRILCHVASRADIRPGSDAERIWLGIVTRYDNPDLAA